MLTVVNLGLTEYLSTLEAMRRFTGQRSPGQADELWLTMHPPVFTMGQAAKREHVLDPGEIPVVASDRGGQVTYHGPGQVVAYLLLDLHGHGLGVRELVTRLERAVVDLLAEQGIEAHGRRDAPGVYVGAAKIAALGLRVRRGCCYHGVSLNVAMDLEPFGRINPCGFPGLAVTQLSDLGGPADPDAVGWLLARHLARALGFDGIVVSDTHASAPHLTHSHA